MPAFEVEANMQHSPPQIGYAEDLWLPVGAWRDKSGLTLTATTEPDVVEGTGDGSVTMWVLKWDHGGTTTDFLSLMGTVCNQFAQGQDRLQIVCAARKVDAGGDENADLCLAANIRWFEAGVMSDPATQSPTGTVPTIRSGGAGDTAIQTLTTPARALLAACNTAATTTNLTGWGEYVLDIGARLRAENKRIEAGAAFQIMVFPHEQVGSSDMDLQITIPRLRIRRHASLTSNGNAGSLAGTGWSSLRAG